MDDVVDEDVDQVEPLVVREFGDGDVGDALGCGRRAALFRAERADDLEKSFLSLSSTWRYFKINFIIFNNRKYPKTYKNITIFFVFCFLHIINFITSQKGAIITRNKIKYSISTPIVFETNKNI